MAFPLSPAQARVLLAMANGSTLKSHRYLDGRKVYRLHRTDSASDELIRRGTVEALHERGLIDSNKKFPAATYLLTDEGRLIAEEMGNSGSFPLTASGW